MTKPCPLYLKPADVLAAFSGDLDRIAQPAPLARRLTRFRFTGVRTMLSAPANRPWRAAIDGVAAARPGEAADDATRGGFDAPPGRPIADRRARGLLSHFAMVPGGV